MLDVIFALSVIAAAFALYFKIQRGRILRRLLRQLEEQAKQKKDEGA